MRQKHLCLLSGHKRLAQNKLSLRIIEQQDSTLHQYSMRITLYQPQIAENVGNIIRLAANTDSELHLIRPYGFIWHNRKRKRAALDYEDDVSVTHHDNFAAFWQYCISQEAQCHLLTTQANTHYNKLCYAPADFLLFGAETHGVDALVRTHVTSQVRIPMQQTSRSINLANSVAVVLYEALRQQDFSCLR